MDKERGKLVHPRAERCHLGDDAFCLHGFSFRKTRLGDPYSCGLQCPLPP